MPRILEAFRDDPFVFFLKSLIAVIGLSISLFQLYTGAFGVFDAYLQRTIHVLPLMALVFLIKPSRQSWSARRNAIIDLPLALLALMIGLYLVLNHGRLASREWYWGPVENLDVILGVVMIVMVLEAARRVTGWALPIVAVCFIAYAMFGGHLPYPFTIRAPSPLLFIDHMFLTTQSIFGIPTGVSATFVFLFILLGAFMEQTGASRFIINFSMALVGRTTGGPAKVAVIASGLFGTVSGHSVANVYGTGTITIPLMKRMGFSKDYSGAVEAAASTGGQLMPPIMGAAAFIMAEMLGVNYLSVLGAAIVPALLYYVAVFSSVHLEAVRLNLAEASGNDIPDMKTTLKEGAHFFIPLVTLVVVLFSGYTPFRAAFIAILTLIVVSAFKKSSRLSLQGYFDALVNGARQSTVIAVSCACAGIVVGVLDVTGVGLKFVTIVTNLSMGFLPLTLLLVMVSCLVLGMGVPTAPAYIVVAMIAAPTLTQMGIEPIAAHMFVFYSALLSAITPPVALAAYAGAAISGGNVMRTAVIATKLGFVSFVVPYLFVYNNALLGLGSTSAVAWTFTTGVVGVITVAVAFQGQLFARLELYLRVLLAITGLAILHHSLPLNIGALLVLALVVLFLKRQSKRQDVVSEPIT
jgi:TRAP transporter 4TM/12TM fusion protein